MNLQEVKRHKTESLARYYNQSLIEVQVSKQQRMSKVPAIPGAMAWRGWGPRNKAVGD